MENLSPEWAMVIVTTIYALFTLLVMVATIWMAWETRQARALQEAPQIDAFLERGKDYNGELYLVIKNNGSGGAYNLRLELKEDFDTFRETKYEEYKKLSYQGPFKNGISFLPPEGTREILLGIFMGKEFEELIKKTINLTIRYQTVTKKQKIGNFILSFSELENTLLLPGDPLFEISKYLGNLSKKVDSIASGFYRIRTITQTKKEYDEELKSHMESLAQKKKR